MAGGVKRVSTHPLAPSLKGVGNEAEQKAGARKTEPVEPVEPVLKHRVDLI